MGLNVGQDSVPFVMSTASMQQENCKSPYEYSTHIPIQYVYKNENTKEQGTKILKRVQEISIIFIFFIF